MSPPDDPRRAELLTASIQVFSRYGYKKTSMDEVARAVGLSRQGLYLHFPSKEVLFTAAVELLVDRSLALARAELHREGPLEDRLVAAFVAVNGAYVAGSVDATHLAELLATATELAGDSMPRFARELHEALTTALLPEVGDRAAELAEVLELVSAGAKHHARSPADYAVLVRRGVAMLLRTTRG